MLVVARTPRVLTDERRGDFELRGRHTECAYYTGAAKPPRIETHR